MGKTYCGSECYFIGTPQHKGLEIICLYYVSVLFFNIFIMKITVMCINSLK